ncbi:hypothetical protein GGI23_000095 [Coemansia sp. RSA 2559]|nr:hypothetical protein GGI23_000095 [Coemansia sp. RSA 2559]
MFALRMADTNTNSYGQPTAVLAGARIAAIVLSSISAAASLMVIVSYIRVFRRFEAHQRKILNATEEEATAKADPSNDSAVNSTAHHHISGMAVGHNRRTLHHLAPGNTNNPQAFGGSCHLHCFSCESSLATPCANNSFFSPERHPPTQLSVSEAKPMSGGGADAATGGNNTQVYRSSMPPLSHAAAQAVHPLRKSNDSSSRATSLDRYRLASNGTANHEPQPLLQLPMDWRHGSVSIELVAKRSLSSASAQQHCEDSSGIGILPPRESSATSKSPSASSQPPPPHSGSRRRLLHYPISYCNQIANAITAERTAGAKKGGEQGGDPKRYHLQRLPRIPSSKIAILSGIDLLMHLLWIINTTATQTVGGCTATLFFYQWAQLFYMFFLASFATRWAMRLRNLKTVHSSRQRRANMIHSIVTLVSSLVFSLLPAVMGNGTSYDSRINACWFARNDGIALRWLWMSLDLWVALALLLLVAVSVYVCIILSNERRNLMSVIAYPTPIHVAPTIGVATLPARPSIATTNTYALATAAHSGATPHSCGSCSIAPLPLQQLTHKKHDPPSRFAWPMPPLNMYLSNQAGNSSIQGPATPSHIYIPGTSTTSSGSRSSSQVHLNGIIPSRTPVNGSLRRSRSYGLSTPFVAAAATTTTTNNDSGASSKRSSTSFNRRDSSSFVYGQYPATHPIALAHEALHGRPSRRLSLGSSDIRSTSSNHRSSSGCCCRCPAKHVVSPATQAGGMMHRKWTQQPYQQQQQQPQQHQHQHQHQKQQQLKQRHHSDIYGLPNTAAMVQTINNRWSQPGNMGVKAKATLRDANGFAAHRHQPPPVPYLLTAAGSQQLAYDSSGRSRLALHRQLLPPPSSSNRTSITTYTKSPIKDTFPPYSAGIADRQATTSRKGYYFVHPAEISANSSQHRRKYAKHMSMPMPQSYRCTSNPPPASGKQRIHDARNGSSVLAPSSRSSCGGYERSACGTGGFRCSAHGSWKKEANGPNVPAIIPPTHANVPVPVGTCGSQDPIKRGASRWANAVVGWLVSCLPGQHHKDHTSIMDMQKLSPGGVSGLSTYQHRARGQIQRIERRIHRLLTTGAVRVATRALVPLITQLCMVAWSTMHSLGNSTTAASRQIHRSVKDGEEDAMYAAAVILLSLQGLLDMFLYYAFDTQANVSEVSLQSYFPSANRQYGSDKDATTAAASGVRGFFDRSSAMSYAQQQPSLMHLPGDIYYSGSRYSYDTQHQLKHLPSSIYRKSPLDQQHFFPHHRAAHHNCCFHHKPSLTSLTGNGNGTSSFTSDQLHGRWATGTPQQPQGHQQQQQQSWQIHSRSASTDSSNNGRKFAFSTDSLNIRRIADRTSNAMQSDTLNGSDCVAWSHMDALSIQDANSISQFSTTGPPSHQQQQQQQQGHNPHVTNYRPFSCQHMPVLNGWEEADLEEHGSPG